MTALTRHMAGETSYEQFLGEALTPSQVMEQRRLAFAVAPACHWCGGPVGLGWSAEWRDGDYRPCCTSCRNNDDEVA